MSIRAAVFAAFTLIIPAAALANAEEPPRWSIGAGLSSLGAKVIPAPAARLDLGGGNQGLFAGYQEVPVATFFVERRVGDRTWLVLGAAGALSRQRSDPPPDSGLQFADITKDEQERASLSAGVRQALTRPGAAVEVSLQALVEAGVLREVREVTSSNGTKSEIRDTARFAAVTGGLAVERELTSGLALRVSTPLVGASWAKLERRDFAATRGGSSASLFVTLEPRLELRLAF